MSESHVHGVTPGSHEMLPPPVSQGRSASAAGQFLSWRTYRGQRYVEIDGNWKKVLAVVKMADDSGHSDDLRAYHIGPKGLENRRNVTGIPRSLPHSVQKPAYPRADRWREKKKAAGRSMFPT